MNVAIYSRKSCVTDTGESIQNQIDICKAYIFNHINNSENCNLIVYKDEGFSAKNTDRPEFKKMMKDAENKKISHIVCYRLDRISRNIVDFSRLIEKLGKMNVSFICVKEQFDTSVAMGRAMMYIASVFAQLERETIAERVRDNMMMLSKHGQWLGGTTPLGMKSYKISSKNIDSNSKYKFYLKENEQETGIVKEIYYIFSKCASLTKTKIYLDSIGIKSRNGNSFSIPAIKKILMNPVYCPSDRYARNYFENIGAEVCFSEKECNPKIGIIAYNKRNYCKNNGKINSISDWVIAQGCHKSVVSSDIWIRVNEILVSKKYEHKIQNALFSGKIICKLCNSKMLLKSRKSHAIFDYICANKIYNSTINCRCNNINGNYIDKLIAFRIFSEGLKKNSFFTKKINSLKNNSFVNININFQSNPTQSVDIFNIIENIVKNAQMCFVNKIIDYALWDGSNLSVILKNCN